MNRTSCAENRSNEFVDDVLARQMRWIDCNEFSLFVAVDGESLGRQPYVGMLTTQNDKTEMLMMGCGRIALTCVEGTVGPPELCTDFIL